LLHMTNYLAAKYKLVVFTTRLEKFFLDE
jgi:hypothetical protein